jgi:hypothetical protein
MAQRKRYRRASSAVSSVDLTGTSLAPSSPPAERASTVYSSWMKALCSVYSSWTKALCSVYSSWTKALCSVYSSWTRALYSRIGQYDYDASIILTFKPGEDLNGYRTCKSPSLIPLYVRSSAFHFLKEHLRSAALFPFHFPPVLPSPLTWLICQLCAWLRGSHRANEGSQ